MNTEIKYIITNQVSEQTKADILNYIQSIQDFEEAKIEAAKLVQSFIDKRYSEAEITSWIECEIKFMMSGERYEYTTYAYAKSPHNQIHSFVSENRTHNHNTTGSEYTRDRNIAGQKIIDAFAVEAQKAQEIAEIQNNLLDNIVLAKEMTHNGKTYQISEIPEEESN